MKELTKDSPYEIRRCGYSGSGFVFYFVRCHSRKALGDYVAKLPNGKRFKKGEEPYGYSYSHWTTTLPGTLPESHDGALWEAHIIVAECGVLEHGEIVTKQEERRHWYHEIGHTVDAFMDAYGDAVTVEEVCADKVVESPAYCNEFLCESLDLFLSGTDAPAASGLPFIMPWIGGGK